MRITQTNRKLDYKKVSFFYIKEKRSNMNFKLELLNWIRFYSVFYVKRLKLVNPKILIQIKKLPKLSQYNEYEIEKIEDYDSETHQYIVK